MKPKILYISSVLPDTSCGARIAIYRHFILRDDFDVALISYDLENDYIHQQLSIKRRRLGQIMHRTRLARIYYNFVFVANWYFLPQGVLNYARSFNPDVVMTVPDNIHPGIALQISKKLDIPLIADYQDLFPLSQFFPNYCKPYSWVRRFLMKKYFHLNSTANKPLYTSEGMMKFFQSPENGEVLYPIGDATSPIQEASIESSEQKFTIVYAGNCYGSYGRMLLKFAKEVIKSDQIHLKIFPVGKDWNEKDIDLLTQAGIYQSFLPFEELKKELKKANGFLTVMSFEKGDQPFVQTSFTTKWLDYAPFAKPIFVWAPSYSSASLFAKKHECGVVYEEDNARGFLKLCESTISDSDSTISLGNNAKTVAQSVLNPESIHNTLRRSITELIE